ncbi:putative thiol oxidase [Lupinus albus]|uniref:Putative thiol oxidase n=1 Tax=Lupinus albus TaxID=3870 RepID=A0A6A4NIU4_LUPAL|nr:putative thiol oxidase [Lupinus albus]
MSSFSLLSLVDILRCRYLLYTKDGESQFAFNATCDFVYNFFICEECRQHFYKMCSRYWRSQIPKDKLASKAALPSCYLGYDYSNKKIERNQDEVYKFLTNYYGKTLASLYKDKSIVGNDRTDVGAEDLMVEATNAVVVPLGAALAIAVASCAVGALACYWRSRQKSRKYFHHLHSLKSI